MRIFPGSPDLRKLTRDQILQATAVLHLRFITVEKMCDLENPNLLKQALDPFKWATAELCPRDCSSRGKKGKSWLKDPQGFQRMLEAKKAKELMAGEMHNIFQEAAASSEKASKSCL